LGIRILTILVSLGLLAGAGVAHAQRLDAGVVVGYHEPLYQDDATDDLLIGLRLRIPLKGAFMLEPAFQWFEMDRGPYRIRGVPQEVQEWQILAGTAGVSWGPTLGRRHLYRPYLHGAVGMFFLRKDEAPDSERPGFDVGAGLSAELSPDLDVDARLSLARVSLERGGSRAIVSIAGGLYYRFGQYRSVRR